MHSSFNADIECFVLDNITVPLPHSYIDKKQLFIPKNIKLADSSFNYPNNIDLLIGSDLFFKILRGTHIPLDKFNLSLHKTVFGYIIAGPILNKNSSLIKSCHLTSHCKSDDLNENVKKFWALGELSLVKIQSNDDKICDEHFEKTFKGD